MDAGAPGEPPKDAGKDKEKDAPTPSAEAVVNAKPPRDQRDAPLRKLTTGLLGTYKLINQRYYEAKKARQARSRSEEYQVTPGDVLGGHYKVDESLGKGSFGQVVSATDQRNGAKVAVKVIKNKDAFRRQARTEIRLLELLNKKDPDDQWCIGACVMRAPPRQTTPCPLFPAPHAPPSLSAAPCGVTHAAPALSSTAACSALPGDVRPRRPHVHRL
jgi:hypothetical protein